MQNLLGYILNSLLAPLNHILMDIFKPVTLVDVDSWSFLFTCSYQEVRSGFSMWTFEQSGIWVTMQPIIMKWLWNFLYSFNTSKYSSAICINICSHWSYGWHSLIYELRCFCFFQAVQFQISVLPWKLLLTFFAQTKISRLMFPISADTNADEEQSYH